MKQPLRYSEALTYCEYLLATRSEEDLEDMLEASSVDGPIDASPDIKAALRAISAMQANGTYYQERNRLHNIYVAEQNSKAPEAVGSLQFDTELIQHMRNLFAGMQSPDPEQKQRFEEFWAASGLDGMSLQDAKPFISLLEKAKTAKRRPKYSVPWAGVRQQLNEMRLLINEQGQTIPQAARTVAEIECLAHRENRAGYFEKKFREREAARE